MQKILTFAWKQLQYVYSDTGLLLFMLITPLALATIIGLAFGGGGGTISISTIPMAIVNLDEGSGDTNYGDTIASILLSEPPVATNGNGNSCSLVNETATEGDNTQQQSLGELFAVTALDDPELAREGVNDGTYRAAVIIPVNFTASLEPDIDFFNPPDSPEDIAVTPTSIEIYGSGGSPISSVIVRSVTESVASQIVTGAVTINATISTILSEPLNGIAMATAGDEDFADFGCAFIPDVSTIQLNRLPINDVQAESSFVQILVAMGSAQAVFFAIFTMNNSLLSIYQDKQRWILQRLLMTPTPRLYVIAGKILGAMVLVFFQVGLLLLALTVIASIVMGQPMFIWGSNIFLLLLLTLVVGLSVSGLGVFVIGLAKNPEQANIFGTLVALAMAVLGGAFGFSLGDISQVSIIYWGVDGYQKLSGGSNDILLNLAILLVSGSILFVIGAWLFNQRIEV